MAKLKQVTEITDPDTAPGVIAYRVGQLEVTVKAGFKEHNDKLDNLINNFATKEELALIQSQINDWRWYLRALVTAVLFALGTAITAMVVRK